MRKETKIAIFTIVTLALAIWGYKYLRGFDILSKKTTLYAVYGNVDGLRISTPVYIHGLQVGLVANFAQEKNDLTRIRVEMQIDPKIKIPKTATAEIVMTSLMGGSAINLVFDGTCSGDDCVKSGDTVKGVMKGMLASFATPDEVRVYVDELNKGLRGVLDTLAQRLSESKEISESVHDIRTILTNLKSTTGQLDRVMAQSSGSIQATLKNIEAITGTLKESNQSIKNIISNADAVSTNLRDADMKSVADETKATMQKLQSTLTASEKAIADLGAVMENLKSGDGAMAMLLNDKEFAANIELTMKNLDLLLRDVRLHPERYRRILSKKKMEYEYAPLEEDPAFKRK